MLETAISEAPVQGLDDAPGKTVWLEALPARVYHTPIYGPVPITPDKLNNFVKNFKENVRGQEVATDFDHGFDKAKGNQASGWYRDFEVRPSSDDPNQQSLWTAVEFTEDAAKELKDKKWKYFSLDWEDEWEDTDGNKHKDVVVGGALTNRPIAKKTMPINFSEAMWKELDSDTKLQFAMTALEAKNESKEMEHSEPGTGSPPEPRKDEDGSDDPAIKGGWRRDPLPVPLHDDQNKGGDKVPTLKLNDEQIEELRKLFDIKVEEGKEEDAGKTLVTAATTQFSEMVKFKNAVNESDEEKQFAEKYPHVWAEHQANVAKNREHDAKQFSENVKVITRTEGDKQIDTEAGLSALALEQVKETHKKFSEGTATVQDFEKTIDTIVHGGLVDYKEEGSSHENNVVDIGTPQAIANARKMFAERVAEVQAEKDQPWSGDTSKAFTEAGKRHPELLAGYRAAIPA